MFSLNRIIFLIFNYKFINSEAKTMSDVKNRVKRIITNQLEFDADILADDATFKDLGADSIEIVELIIAFEVEFDIEIPEKDAEKLHSLKDIYTYIENTISKK